MKTGLCLSWNLILGLFVWIQYAEAARATTLILGKTKPEPKIDTIPTDDENATAAIFTSSNETSGINSQGNVTHKLTGVPQIDYIYDPNLPRELNGYNLTDYPFYNSVPEDIDFKCDGLHDGFYASVPHKCQVYHHCLFGTRYDFLCANYTAFDQKTFICHFASEIDCKNSPKHYNRNEALYKAATTTTAAPPVVDYSKYRRPHPDESRRRRPYRKRKPTYEYYDDYEDSQDYYEDEDPPPPPISKRKKRPRPNNRDSYKERDRGEEIEDYEEKEILPPSAPNKSLYDRPRIAPKIRRPVPTNERDKYDYGNDPRVIKQPSEEKSRTEDFEADEKRKEHSHRKPEKSDSRNSGEESSESENYRRGNHREKNREDEKRPSKKRRPPSSENYEDEVELPSRQRTKSEGFNKRRESEEELKEEEKEKEGAEKSEEEDEEDEERYVYYSKDRRKDFREKEYNRAPHPHRFKEYDDYTDERPTTKSRGENHKNRQDQSSKYSKPNEYNRDEILEDLSEKNARRKPVEPPSDDSKIIRMRNKEVREKNIKNQGFPVSTQSRESLKNKQRNNWEGEKSVSKASDKEYDDEDQEDEEKERDEIPRRNVKNSGLSSDRSGESSKNTKGIVQRVKISKEAKDDSDEDFAPVPAPRPAYITDIGKSENMPVRPQNRKVPNVKISSKEPAEEEDDSEEKISRSQIGSKKSKESGERKEEQDRNEGINLKVPFESLNEELAPRAPQFPQVSLRRRPFLPSRGGFLPRGLLPVGEKSSLGPVINHKNPQQEHVKSRDRDVIEFRTKVSASIGVEQPQLTSHFVESAEPVRTREHPRDSSVENVERSETLPTPHDEQINGGNQEHEESITDHSSIPFKPYSATARYNSPTEKVNFRPQSTENSNIFLSGRYQSAKDIEASGKSEEKRKDSSLHSSSPLYTFSNPQERLGPQTFYSENPKFKTTLVVPDHLVPKSAQTPNIKYNTYRPPAVRQDQKSDSSHLYGETNFRKPNSPSYDYAIANAGNLKFPTKTTDDNISNDYDDSLNDALQQYSTLHPRNVPSGLLNQNNVLQLQQQQLHQHQHQQQHHQQQPQGFKRRHHEQESVSTFYPTVEKQPINLSTSRIRNILPPRRQHPPVQKLTGSSSTLHQSYIMAPYLGVLRKHPTDVFTRVQ